MKETARQLTANSLLVDRESIILTIAKGNEGYNDQNDVDSNDSGVHQID
jgi:hypothetical protein